MSLLLIAPNQNINPLKDALLVQDPNLEIEIWPEIKDKKKVTFAVSWNHPKNALGNYPNLTAVSSFGAGANHLLTDKSIDASIKICRIVTNALQQHISDYILNAVSSYRFHSLLYIDQMRKAEWKLHRAIPREDCVIGLLGVGQLGTAAGMQLRDLGYNIHSWSRSRKDIEGITSHAGKKEFSVFLKSINILICLLPLTSETEGILNLNVFKQMKKPAYLINVGRGSHLVDEDLIYALDAQILNGACLDVFENEPLPENHPFWNRKNIMITPHIAGYVKPEESASVILENYKRSLSGMDLINEIDRKKEY